MKCAKKKNSGYLNSTKETQNISTSRTSGQQKNVVHQAHVEGKEEVAARQVGVRIEWRDTPLTVPLSGKEEKDDRPTRLLSFQRQ